MMDDTKKMLVTIINGQSAMKVDLLGEIGKLRKEFLGETGKLNGELDSLRQETRNGFVQVNKRIDKIGKQLAYLEDDAPTKEEFGELEKRVGKLETKFVSA